MFQLWNLVLLCGLLTGTSASLLGNLGNGLIGVDPVKSVLGNGLSDVDPVKSVLGNGLNDVDPVKSVLGNGLIGVDPVKSVLGNGLSNVDSVQSVVNVVNEDTLQNLKVDLGALQETKDFSLAKGNIVEALNVGIPSISTPTLINGLRLKVNNLRILDIQASLAADGNGINLKFPLAADISLWLPIIGQTVDLDIKLNLITGLNIKTDPKTNLPVLVVGKCSSDDDKISLSLLGRKSRLINIALDSVTKLLEKTVTFLLQKQVCPLIQFFTDNLKVELVQSLTSTLQALPVQVPTL